VLAEQLSGTFNGTLEFAAEAEGLYPFRLVYFERGGGAHVELFQVNRSNPNDRILINDTTVPSAIRAWRTVALPEITVESAATLDAGAFSPDTTGTIDTVNQRITMPLNGAVRFYRLSATTALTIESIAVEGDQVILTYQ
jgi:hypothetical protein